jgi:GR25 family glycosyltransferase involved in LPS biosynthesis
MNFIYILFLILIMLYFRNNSQLLLSGGNNIKSNIIPQILVINLDRRPERWKFVKKQLDEQYLNYIRYSAIDGQIISDYDKYKYVSDAGINETRIGLKLTKGAIGLAITFYNICIFCSNNKKDCILFEDDITITNNFISKFKSIQTELNNIDYDIIYLGYGNTIDKSKLTKVSNNIYKSTGQVNGTFGLLLSSKNCNKIIKSIYPLDWQIDTALYMATNINRYIVFPELITSPSSTNDNTDIQN